jgi:hypothetical protein
LLLGLLCFCVLQGSSETAAECLMMLDDASALAAVACCLSIDRILLLCLLCCYVLQGSSETAAECLMMLDDASALAAVACSLSVDRMMLLCLLCCCAGQQRDSSRVPHDAG